MDFAEIAWPYTTGGYSQTHRTKQKSFTETLPNVIVQRATYRGSNCSVSLLYCCLSLHHPIILKKKETLKTNKQSHSGGDKQPSSDPLFTLLQCKAMAEGVVFGNPYLIMCLRDSAHSLAASSQSPKVTIFCTERDFDISV